MRIRPRSGMALLSAFSMVLTPLAFSSPANAGTSVTTLAQVSGGLMDWGRVAISSDGTKMAATLQSGDIYVSSDSGIHWANVSTSLGSKAWSSIAISGNGDKIIAGEMNGGIYTSSNFGGTWNSYENLGFTQPFVAISADGERVAVATCSNDGKGIQLSSFNSPSWTRAIGASSGCWLGISMSGGGNKIVASLNNDYLYVSPDSGSTWLRQDDAGQANWQAVSMSGDGKTIIAAEWGGRIWESHDPSLSWSTSTTWDATPNSWGYWGAVSTNLDGSASFAVRTTDPFQIWAKTAALGGWTELGAHTNKQWSSIAISGDGTKIIGSTVIAADGHIYTSSDLATTLQVQPLAGTPYWKQVVSSVDGIKLAGIGSDSSGDYGQIYLSGNAGSTWSQSSLPIGAWNKLQMSTDGSTLFALKGSNSVYVSRDSGANWEAKPFTNGQGYFINIAISNDGSKAIITGGESSFYSSDFGATWNPSTIVGAGPNPSWDALAFDGNGINALMGDFTPNTGKILKSSDGGATWSATSAPTYGWSTVSMGEDGSKSVALSSDSEHIITSSDLGATWSPISLPTQDYYFVLGASVDASTMVLVGSGAVYRSTDLGITWDVLSTLGMRYWNGFTLNSDGTTFFALPQKSGSIYVVNIFPEVTSTLNVGDTFAVFNSSSLLNARLAFGALTSPETITATQASNPASINLTPFVITGAIQFFDISSTGSLGQTTICADGLSDSDLWHFVNSAWVKITTFHQAGQVCGVTSTFSPFAVGVERVTYNNPVQVSQPIPVPEPIQQSKIDSFTASISDSGKLRVILIQGTFNEEIVSVQVNGNSISRDRWVQVPTKFAISFPLESTGTFSIQIYNGAVPVLPAQLVTISAPVVKTDAAKPIEPAPVVTPTPTPTPTPKPTASTPAKAPSRAKVITIKCVKGKTVKMVKAVKPSCPSGYAKK